MPEPVYARSKPRQAPGRLSLHDAAWAMAAGMLVIGLAWLGLLPPVDDTAEPHRAPADPMATAAPGWQRGEPLPGPAEGGSAALPAALGAQPATVVPDGPAEVEVCGYGRVALASDDPNPLQRMPAALRQAALAQAEARMLASGEAAVRAAALLIGAQSPGGRSRIQQLARLAANGSDPVVYGLALQACKAWSRTEAAGCSLLSNAQWARLEPDNLQPWLELAAEAAAQDDEPAEDQAMRQAARATRSDERAGLLPALVGQALAGTGAQLQDNPAPALQRALALSLARTIQDGWLLTRGHHADSYCSTDAVAADRTREGVCNAVAQTLATRGSSLGDLASAAAIGRQLGWPESRLLPLLQEQQAMVQLAEAAGESAAAALDFSCERLARHTAWSSEIGRRGELQALRVRLQQARPDASPGRAAQAIQLKGE